MLHLDSLAYFPLFRYLSRTHPNYIVIKKQITIIFFLSCRRQRRNIRSSIYCSWRFIKPMTAISFLCLALRRA